MIGMWKHGRPAFACSASGITSTSQSRAWVPSGSCGTSHSSPGRCVSCITGLEKQQGEKAVYLQAKKGNDMSETTNQGLSGVPETLLIPLYVRAMESQRPDAMMKDEKAVALVTQKSFDFTQVRQIPMSEALNVMRIMQAREYDR